MLEIIPLYKDEDKLDVLGLLLINQHYYDIKWGLMCIFFKNKIFKWKNNQYFL